MRSKIMKRACVTAATVAALTADGLAGAGTSSAAPASSSVPAAAPAAGAEAIGVLAVNNLGLDTAHAKSWQCLLRDRARSYGFPGPGTIDGQLGTNSWKAAQNLFKYLGYYSDSIDGIVGPNTIKGLQRYLNLHGASLTVDGIAGPATRSAFWSFARTDRC
ncbi:peptidoglycan-binding domain-containing protein [Streptomyces sp. CC219B]|uniref:peptidoglycan-binding domain-containing protein n=1 Tax=Streptomyces sp. CC219B TaxID=3044574 RepID=UPI0024A8D07E|nr:peptidoglycan-binding domain-containing protein [Streptomyces sp. CC219B]